MNVVFFYPEDGEDDFNMEAVPRVGDVVQLGGELYVVEKVEWSPGEVTDHGNPIPPRAYVYLADTKAVSE